MLDLLLHRAFYCGNILPWYVRKLYACDDFCYQANGANRANGLRTDKVLSDDDTLWYRPGCRKP